MKRKIRMTKVKSFFRSPILLKLCIFFIVLIITQSAHAAGSPINPKKALGWVKWIVIVIISIACLLAVLKGVMIYPDDASKGKMAFMGAILGAIMAGMVMYAWEKVFGNKVNIDLETDF